MSCLRDLCPKVTGVKLKKIDVSLLLPSSFPAWKQMIADPRGHKTTGAWDLITAWRRGPTRTIFLGLGTGGRNDACCVCTIHTLDVFVMVTQPAWNLYFSSCRDTVPSPVVPSEGIANDCRATTIHPGPPLAFISGDCLSIASGIIIKFLSGVSPYSINSPLGSLLL